MTQLNSLGYRPSSKNDPCAICSNTSGHCKTTSGSGGDTLHLCHNHTTNPGHIIDGLKWLKTVGDWGMFGPMSNYTHQPTPMGSHRPMRAVKPQPVMMKGVTAIEREDRDTAFREYFSKLSTHPEDVADLRRRGLTDEDIKRWDVHSKAGSDPGYLCPCVDPEGYIVGAQWRSRLAASGRYKWVKWIGAGTNNGGELPLTVHRPLEGSKGIAVCESIGAKSFLLSKRSGMTVVGAGNCGQFTGSPWHWKTYLETLSVEHGSKLIHLYPDSGANIAVVSQYVGWLKMVAAWGFEVVIAQWEAIEFKGHDLDDLTEEQFGAIRFVTATEWALGQGDGVTLEEPGTDDEQGFLSSLVKESKSGTVKFQEQSVLATNISDRWSDISYDEAVGSFLTYENGLWTEVLEGVVKKKLSETLNQCDVGYSSNLLDGLFKLFKVRASKSNWKRPSRNLIPLKNGVLDLKTREFTAHSPEHGFRWQLPYDYEPEATPGPVLDWLIDAQEGHNDRVQLLRAFLNVAITGKNIHQKFLEISSTRGNTGKGVFCSLAKCLVGGQNVYAATVGRLDEPRFEMGNYRDKSIVFFADASKHVSDNALEALKRIVGRDDLMAERKGVNGGVTFTFDGLIIMAANQTLSIDDGHALYRRKIPVPFMKVVAGKDIDKELLNTEGNKVTGKFVPHLPGFFNWVLDMPEEEVTAYLGNSNEMAPSLAKANQERLIESSPLAAWVHDSCAFSDDLTSRPGKLEEVHLNRETEGSTREGTRYYKGETEFLYPSYVSFCKSTGAKPLSVRTFTPKFLSMCNDIMGKSVTQDRRSYGMLFSGVALKTAPSTPKVEPIAPEPIAPEPIAVAKVATQLTLVEPSQPDLEEEEVWTETFNFEPDLEPTAA